MSFIDERGVLRLEYVVDEDTNLGVLIFGPLRYFFKRYDRLVPLSEEEYTFLVTSFKEDLEPLVRQQYTKQMEHHLQQVSRNIMNKLKMSFGIDAVETVFDTTG